MRRLLALITIAFLITSCGKVIEEKVQQDYGQLPSTLGGGVSIPGTDTTTFTLDEDNTGAPGEMAIIFNRGTESDVQLAWDETNDQFEFNADLVAEKALATPNIVSFTDQDDTPSVANANIFKTANTASTTITMFNDGKTGQRIEVIVGDDYTTIDFTGTNLKGNDGNDWSPDLNDRLSGTFDGTYWYCDVGMTTSDAGGDPPGTSSTTFTLDDDNSGSPADMAVVFNRGTSADVQLGWDETNDQFEFDDDLAAEKAFLTPNIPTFTAQDDTPSVANANVFKTANTSATAITMFDDGKTGQDIRVVINDEYTTFDFTGTNLKGNDSVDWSPGTGDILYATFDGTYWYCDIGLTTSDVGGGGSGDDIDLTKSDASGSPQTVNLPTAVGKDEDLYVVVKTDSSSNAVTIDPNGSETIDSASKIILRRQYECWVGVSDNANWFTVATTGSFINVKYFGATGDGTTDDTASIQAAIAACNTADILYFPRGNYYVSAELTITKNLWVRGDGTCTQVYQSADASLFSFTAAGVFRISDMRLGGEGSSADTCLVKATANASHGRISNLLMIGSYYGIGLYGALFITIQEVANTDAFYRAVAATNESWIYGERHEGAGKSVNSLSLISITLQTGKRGIYLTDDNSEGTFSMTGGIVESMTVKGIYITGYKQGGSISGVHLEGAATSGIELNDCSDISVAGVFCPAFTITSCRGIDVRNSYLWGGITVNAASQNINIQNCMYETTPDISGQNLDVSGLYDVGGDTTRGLGKFFPKSHISNLVDGDLEVWDDADQPLDFVGNPTAASIVEESTIVKFGSKSAKVICDAGQTSCNLKHSLDGTRWDWTETYPLRFVTIRFWAYKPAADGFNPRVAVGYDGGVSYFPTFSLNTEEWTPCQQTVLLAAAAGWDNPIIYIGNSSCAPGDSCYFDGVTITEGNYAPPSFDDGRGKEGNFRVSGNLLRGGENTTMTGNETFTYSDGNLFIKDPGGASRNFNPSGAFPEGTEITVINKADAAENIVFDSGTLACPVRQDQRGVFVYDGAAWQIQSVTNTQGDKQSFSFMQSDVASSQAAVALDVLGLAGNVEYTMPYPGSIVGISIASNAARTAGTLTVDATIDGDVTGLQAVLNADNAQYHSATQARNADAFTVNKRIGVKITTDADWEPDGTPDIVEVVIVEM